VTVKLALPEQFLTFHLVTGGGQRIDLPPKKWTGLGGFFLLLDRGDLSDRGVKPGSVVKAFDEGEDIPHRLDAGFVLAMMDEFGLQGMKEALHGGIVEAIGFAAHGSSDADARKVCTIGL
jgi:hypothetical protein